jgi:hypothetical protein
MAFAPLHLGNYPAELPARDPAERKTSSAFGLSWAVGRASSLLTTYGENASKRFRWGVCSLT